MRILITGAGGFVGSRLAFDLARCGHQVTGTWLNDRSRFGEKLPDGISLARLDLADAAAIRSLFDTNKFDAVVNCAAQVRIDNNMTISSVVSNNVLSQANLLDAALAPSCRRFISCSTIGVYGSGDAPPEGYREEDAAPCNLYGWSKRAAENILELGAVRNGLRAVSLRLAGVHGAGRVSGALATMTRAARAGETIIVTEPASRFRWLFIDDLVDAVRLMIESEIPVGHSIVNLASADMFTLGELAALIVAATDSDSAVTKCSGKPNRNEVMNIDRVQALFGYVPKGLGHHLRIYLDSVQDQQ